MGFSFVKSAFCRRSFLGTTVVFLLCGASIVSVIAALSVTASGGGRLQRSGLIEVKAPRVVVLKSKRILHLFDGDQLVRSYSIDLGTTPKGDKRHRGDGRTPLGTFRVVTRNAKSRYHRFLGLDFPNRPAVESGRANGLVSPGEASAILEAIASGRCPDWSTALGGGIGIHGRSRGFDWTAGCIAVSDDNVEELFDVLRIGDTVEILP